MRYDKVFFQRHQIEIPNNITIFTYLQKWIEHRTQEDRKKPERHLIAGYAETFADDPLWLKRAVIYSMKTDRETLHLDPLDQLRWLGFVPLPVHEMGQVAA